MPTLGGVLNRTHPNWTLINVKHFYPLQSNDEVKKVLQIFPHTTVPKVRSQ